MKRVWVLAWAITAALLLVPAAAGAATLTVNTTADLDTASTECPDASGASSLRQCLDKAANNGEDDTINFNLPAGSTITLSNLGGLNYGPLSSTEKLAIAGPGASQLTIAGSPDSNAPVIRFFNGDNTLSGVTITGGEGTGLQAAGINNEGGKLSLNNIVVTGNHNDAGGIQGAGGVLNTFADLTIRSSTISNNVVDNANSGGGGGVVSHPGDIVIINSTISGNKVNGSGTNTGGGLWNAQGGGTMRLLNVTVSNNSSGSGVGGIEDQGSAVDLANTIVAGNSGPGAPDCKSDNSLGDHFVSQGYNLIGSTDGCAFTGTTGDKVNLSPQLGGLAQNGGPTPTMALLQGSPAINGGNPNGVADTEPLADPPSLVSCRTTDQRGITRPQLGTCDIGAYEYAPGVADAAVPPCSQNAPVTVTVTPAQGGFSQAVHFQIDNGPEQRVPTSNNVALIAVPPGQHTLIYWAEGQGGDQELSGHTATVLVDNTDPTLRVTSDQRKTTYTRGSKGSITITASDALSPLTRNPSKRHRRISTSRLGRFTLSFTAVDSCGHKTTRLFRYRVVSAAREPVRRRGSTNPRFTG